MKLGLIFLKIQLAIPGYAIPTYERMKDTLIPEKRRLVRAMMEQIIAKSVRVSTVLDLWSSKSMNGYLGVSLSGVNDDFKPFNFVLACREVKERHTSENILRVYEEIIQSWNLSSKIETICYKY